MKQFSFVNAQLQRNREFNALASDDSGQAHDNIGNALDVSAIIRDRHN